MNITVAFKKKGSNWLDRLAGKLISVWTGSKYAHSEILIPDDYGVLYMYSATAMTDGGGVLKKLAPSYSQEKWDMIDVSLSMDELADMRSFLDEQVGKKYDWTGIVFSMVLNLNKHNPNRWFCSELCGEALMRASLIHDNVSAQSLHPGRLHALMELGLD